MIFRVRTKSRRASRDGVIGFYARTLESRRILSPAVGEKEGERERERERTREIGSESDSTYYIYIEDQSRIFTWTHRKQ